MTRRDIAKILIANRGEIAVRVARTCREMGIATVAVFSDADASALHVRVADEGVRLGPAPSSESYLHIERIIEAARRTGCDAIHPGYGFLAENAAFADACQSAGLIFIGPSPAVIRAMGSKRQARRLVEEAGVPVVPGYDGDDQSVERLTAEARTLGLPVLIKASAGGGGKGMQIVRDEGALDEAIEAARRISKSAFGDDTLLIERYVERPRHVEIQILGDQHGALVHLFERECSIQRRHQKIIEETPSTALDHALRDKMGAAAVTVGRAIEYENAGTVEFIFAPDGAFYFLEVNTRLQVEHPVTECVTGLDLVREQIRVAAGEPLGYEQADVQRLGAAIECRLYAEDPARDYLPSSGRLSDWHCPEVTGVRVDAGVAAGDEVPIHYDPLLAKLITQGRDRAEACQRMVRALTRLSVHGVRTNRELLLEVLRHDAFVAGDTDTHFLERHLPEWQPAPLSEAARDELVAAIVLADHARRRELSPGPLPALVSGFRNNPSTRQTVSYRIGDEDVEVGYSNLGGDRFELHIGKRVSIWHRVALEGATIRLEDDSGWRRDVRVTTLGNGHSATSAAGSLVATEHPRFPDSRRRDSAGGCRAPMPGSVIHVAVEAGQTVADGEVLVIIEAMKMEQSIRAGQAGVVERVLVAPGDQVDADEVVVVVVAAP